MFVIDFWSEEVIAAFSNAGSHGPSGLTRRRFLEAVAYGLALGKASITAAISYTGGEPFFRTRGVVLTTDNLTLADWPNGPKRRG